MKGEIIYKILNFLSDQVLNQVDFVNAFLRAGYGASAGKVNYEFSKVQNKRIDLLLNKQKINKTHTSYRVFILIVSKKQLITTKDVDNSTLTIFLCFRDS